MSAETDVDSLAGLAGLIDSTVVDGIPTLLAPREGPVTAGLVFRVGRADETLATSGITHLVEHLALLHLGLSDLQHNGQTADTYTLLHATGTPAEMVTFLNGVCAALQDLPVDHLETVKAILRTEAAGRDGAAVYAAMGLWRYGAQGPGLTASGEAGLSGVTGEDVIDWARERFNRDNAALYLTTDTLPSGLVLRLPPGRRFPVELPAECLPATPAWFRGAHGGVMIDGIVPRGAAGTLFARTAERALYRALRLERGLSYRVTCDYEPMTADLARISAHADALRDKEDAVTRTVVGTLDALRDGGFEEADLAAARKLVQEQQDSPDRGAALLPAAALNLLMGHPTAPPDELRAEQDAVTASDLAESARAFWETALAQVPGEGLDWAGFSPAPTSSTLEVTGHSYPRSGDPDLALVVGDEGVTQQLHGGVATVRFEDCVLLSAVPDGGRMLVGRDGFRVVIEPTLYRGLTREIVVATIDARVPPEAFQMRPERSAADIPRPTGSRKEFRIAPQWRGFGDWARPLGTFLITLAAVTTLMALTQLGAPPSQRLGGSGTAVVVAVAVVAWASGVYFRFGAARRAAL